MPLDAKTEGVPRPRMVARNPETEGGRVITEADLPRVVDWLAARRVTVHVSHFATCPHAKEHRRS
jgi:hypothetical protein